MRDTTSAATTHSAGDTVQFARCWAMCVSIAAMCKGIGGQSLALTSCTYCMMSQSNGYGSSPASTRLQFQLSRAAIILRPHSG